MLTHPTMNKLQTLRLTGMLAALQQQLQMPEINDLNFEERLGLMVFNAHQNGVLPHF